MASKLEFKFRFVWTDEYGNAFGTNDEEIATHFDEFYVIDTHKGELFDSGDALEDAKIPEDEQDEE